MGRKIRTPEQIVKRVFKRWATEVAPAWGEGLYTPSDDQFAEMAIEAINTYRDQVGISFGTWRSELDGTPVVQVDTTDGVGRLRINLNDAPVWDGDPEKDNHPGSHFHDAWAEFAPTHIDAGACYEAGEHQLSTRHSRDQCPFQED